MTLKQLQRYLETEKWRETAKRGTDVCGCYARCAHCNRYDEYPCAEAYLRYTSAPDKEEGDWLLPEPPVRRVFGTDAAESITAPKETAKLAPQPEAVAQPAQPAGERRERRGIPIQHLVRKTQPAPVTEAPAPAPMPEPVVQAAEVVPAHAAPTPKRGGVIARRRRNGTEVRILILFRKGSYGVAES